MRNVLISADGTPFMVNSALPNDQRLSESTTLANGNIVIVWAESRPDGVFSEYNIYAAIYSPDGEELQAPFMVNTYTASDQVLPQVVPTTDGGFAVTWESFGQDSFISDPIFGFRTDQYGLYQQRFDAVGDPVGTETLVNTSVDGFQGRFHTLELPDGGHITLWIHGGSQNPNENPGGSYFQVFDVDGDPILTEQAIPFGQQTSMNTWESTQLFDAVALSDGSIAAVVRPRSTNPGEKWITIFETDGTPVSHFRIHDFTGDIKTIELSDGNILILNNLSRSSTNTDVVGTIYGRDGSVVVEEFKVNQSSSDQQFVLDAIMLSDGTMFVIWLDRPSFQIVGRIIDKDGDPVTDNFKLTPSSMQATQGHLSLSDTGQIVLTFDALLRGDATQSEVFVQLLDVSTDGVFLNDRPNVLNLGEEDDLVDGGKGRDSITGNGGDDTLYGAGNSDTLIGGAGDDVLDGGGGNDRLFGGTQNDRITGGLGDDTLRGGGGDDFLSGGGGANFLDGGDGDDVITAGLIEDVHVDQTMHTIHGGAGNDTISILSGGGIVYGNDGDDAINGWRGKVYGGSGNDTIYAATAFGQSGDDFIVAGSRGNAHGGSGYDILLVKDGAIVNAQTGRIGEGSFRGDKYYGRISGFEEYHFETDRGSGGAFYGTDRDEIVTWETGSFKAEGGGGDDLFRAFDRGNFIPSNVGSSPVRIDAGDGNDTVLAGHGKDSIIGGNGDDLLDGERNKDTIHGGTGNDTIYGGASKDMLVGGDDDDLISGGNGDDTLLGQTGSDTLSGDLGADILFGGDGDDILFGGNGNDSLNGSDGKDVLNGGAGADILNGGAGRDEASYNRAREAIEIDLSNGSGTGGDAEGDVFISIENVTGGHGDDLIVGNESANRLVGSKGEDTLEGLAGRDLLIGGKDNDRLLGGAGKDTLFGGDGDDWVFGGADNDTLFGGQGNDIVIGGAGKDMLTGGASSDTFVFLEASDSGSGARNRDVITDFQRGTDVIDLSAVDAKTGGGNQSFSFIGEEDFSGTKGELRVQKRGDYTLIQGDRDGDGQKDFEIELVGMINLDTDDFIL